MFGVEMNQSKEGLWAKVEGLNGATAPNSEDAADAPQAGAFPEPDDSAADLIDIPRLKSALASLDPDCDERTWMAYRIGPLVNAAKQCPHLHDELYQLAWHFSNGKLRGEPAVTWTKKTKHGNPRRNRLGSLWRYFLKSKYDGEPVQVGSIFFHARQAGWTGENVDEEAGR